MIKCIKIIINVFTCRPWDMSRFLYMQCMSSNIAYPRWAKRWVNIRKVFCNAYHVQRAGVSTMLEILGLAFEGHPHSGIDDARNIARILAQLIADGCNVYENEKLVLSSPSPADDALAAEVAILHPTEDDSLDDADNAEHTCKEMLVVADNDSEQKTVYENKYCELNIQPLPTEPASDDTLKYAELLEHLSL